MHKFSCQDSQVDLHATFTNCQGKPQSKCVISWQLTIQNYASSYYIPVCHKL